MSAVNPQNISVAEARRGDAIQKTRRQLDSLDGEIRRGATGAGGQLNAYLADRLEFLKGERDRLAAEVSRMAKLTGAALVSEFVPEVAAQVAAMENPEPVPTLADALPGRGAMLPQQVVVQKTPLPVLREGGDPGVPWSNQGAGLPGFVPGQVHYPDYASQGYDTGRQ